MATDKGRVAKYRSDHLVVGLAYEALVSKKLQEWQATPDVSVRSSDLGLALIVVNAARAVDFLKTEHPDLTDDANAARRIERLDERSDLDTLHRCLRAGFSQEYAGWVPTLGKDRILDRVDATSVIDLGVRTLGQTSVIDLGVRTLGETSVIDLGLRTLGETSVIDLGRVRAQGSEPIGRPPLWNLPPRDTSPGSGVRVGLVDTKVIPDPWLRGAFEADLGDFELERDRHDNADERENEDTRDHHATFVSGLILQQAPGARIVHRAALIEGGSADSWQVATAIAALARTGLDVLNLSLGCATDDGQPPLVLRAALNALPKDTVVVAAAGNRKDGDKTRRAVYPAAFEEVIAVGAANGDDPSAFSPNEPWVDAFAQGEDVVSTYGGRRDASVLVTGRGTSFSAAIVSGAIAGRIDPHGAIDSGRAAWAQLLQESRDPKVRQIGQHDFGYGERPLIQRAATGGWPRVVRDA